MRLKEKDKEIFRFRIEPKEEELIPLYSKYLEITNSKEDIAKLLEDPVAIDYEPYELRKKPNKKWYKDISILIENYGYDKYRNHVIEVLNAMILLISATSRFYSLHKKMTQDEKNIYNSDPDVLRWKEISNSPTEFYFNCSSRGRYLKGMIHSIECIPDPEIINLLHKFTLIYPYQSGNSTNGGNASGVFLYESIDVFSKLKINKSVPILQSIKYRSRNKWVKKRVDKKLTEIAQKHDLKYDEILEQGLPNFGFNANKEYIKNIHPYKFILSLKDMNIKDTTWLNNETKKHTKSPPKIIRVEHSEFLEFIKQDVKEIEQQIKTQSKRIESYLFPRKNWTPNKFNEFYLENEFIYCIISNFFWKVTLNDETKIVTFKNKNLISIDNEIIPKDNLTNISLWHPIDSDEVERKKINQIFNEQNFQQTFKQCKRECFTHHNVHDFIGSKLNKRIASQLLKSRGWKTSEYSKTILKNNTKIILKVQDAEDGTTGMFYGSSNVIITDIIFQVNNIITESREIENTYISELLRDISMFCSKAKTYE